jgi:hypothetical protein
VKVITYKTEYYHSFQSLAKAAKGSIKYHNVVKRFITGRAVVKDFNGRITGYFQAREAFVKT